VYFGSLFNPEAHRGQSSNQVSELLDRALQVNRTHLARGCEAHLEGRFDLHPLLQLPDDDLQFILKLSVRASGSLKERWRGSLEQSYPTVRNRLDSVIAALGVAEGGAERKSSSASSTPSPMATLRERRASRSSRRSRSMNYRQREDPGDGGGRKSDRRGRLKLSSPRLTPAGRSGWGWLTDHSRACRPEPASPPPWALRWLGVGVSVVGGLRFATARLDLHGAPATLGQAVN